MSGDKRLEKIQQVAQELMPLYSQSGKDRPDAVLSCAPNADRVVEALNVFLMVMLPGHSHEASEQSRDLEPFLTTKLEEGALLLRPELELALPFRWKGEAATRGGAVAEEENAAEVAEAALLQFISRLLDVRNMLIDDVRAAYNGDPAALSFAEVKVTYPSIMAIATHRLAHELYKLGIPIVPRIMSEHIHSLTGIDIHPGATIGRGFFIDHGTGVVVGETTHIGNNVKLYQGVTLGAKSFPMDEFGNPIKHVQRHPTVEDGVVVYANATILGGDTVIGRNSIVGGNVFLMKSVPPGSTVTRPAEGLRINQKNRDIADCSRCEKACGECKDDGEGVGK
ncbi:serine O-acetyltransferase EpsC [Verrucomicrobiota bacterium]